MCACCVEQQQQGSGCPKVVRVVLNSSSTIAIAAPVLGGPEVVRVVLNSRCSTIAIAAPVLGGPEVVRVVLDSDYAARARRAVIASMDPMQRAARHAMRMADTTALQDLLAEVAGRRREAHDTAARISPPRAARGGACGAGDGGCTSVHGRCM